MDHIDQIYYINLDDRMDRNTHIVAQLRRMNIDFTRVTRISALKHDKGYIGCGLSHIVTLEHAKRNNYKNIIVFEDDFEFTVHQKGFDDFLEHLFNTQPDFNMCLLAFNYCSNHDSRTCRQNCEERNPVVDSYLREVHNAQTTSGYIVSSVFYDTLLSTFRESVDQLCKGMPVSKYAIDSHWKRLQGSGKKIFASKVRVGKQTASYSNVENKYVDYCV